MGTYQGNPRQTANPNPEDLVRLLQRTRYYQPDPRQVCIPEIAPSKEAEAIRDHFARMSGVKHAEVVIFDAVSGIKESPEVIQVDLAIPGSHPLLIAAPRQPPPRPKQILFQPPYRSPIARVSDKLDMDGATSATIAELTSIFYGCYVDLDEKLAAMRDHKCLSVFRYTRKAEWYDDAYFGKITMEKSGSTYRVTSTRYGNASRPSSTRVPEYYNLNPRTMDFSGRFDGSSGLCWDFSISSGKLTSASFRKANARLGRLDGPSIIHCDKQGMVTVADWYWNDTKIPVIPQLESSLDIVGKLMMDVKNAHNGKIPGIFWTIARDLLKNTPGAFKTLKKHFEFGNRMVA